MTLVTLDKRAELAPDLVALHALADRLEPELADAFTEAIDRLKDRIDVPALERAIARGDLAAIERLIHLDQVNAELEASAALITQAIEASARLEAAHMPNSAGARFVFDAVNPAAVEVARTTAARLVTNVSEETQSALASTIERALAEAVTPAQTATAIRQLVGLTERQANAVSNYRFGLLEDGIAPARVTRLAEKYSARLLRYRADTIARTEIISAASKGQQELWRQAAVRGVLDPETTRQVWILTPGACEEICAPMPALNKDGVPLGKLFLAGDGRLVSGPPTHPRCRCALGLKFLRRAA